MKRPHEAHDDVAAQHVGGDLVLDAVVDELVHQLRGQQVAHHFLQGEAGEHALRVVAVDRAPEEPLREQADCAADDHEQKAGAVAEPGLQRGCCEDGVAGEQAFHSGCSCWVVTACGCWSAPSGLGCGPVGPTSGGRPCRATPLRSSRWGARRVTHFVPFGHSVQPPPASQMWMRAEARRPPALRSAPPTTSRRARTPSRSPDTTFAYGECQSVSAKAGAPWAPAFAARSPNVIFMPPTATQPHAGRSAVSRSPDPAPANRSPRSRSCGTGGRSAPPCRCLRAES